MRRRRESPDYFAALLWSACLAGASAIVFLVILSASLPETDSARQDSLFATVLLLVIDPFVWILGVPMAGLGTLVAFLMWFVGLRDRSIERCAAVVFAVVCAVLIFATPRFGLAAVYASYSAILVGAVVAHSLPWTLREEDRLARARRRETGAV